MRSPYVNACRVNSNIQNEMKDELLAYGTLVDFLPLLFHPASKYYPQASQNVSFFNKIFLVRRDRCHLIQGDSSITAL